MPSSWRLGEKEGGASERLKGKEGEEEVRRGGGGVLKMPWSLTAGEPMFRAWCIAPSYQLSLCSRPTDRTPCEGIGWPPPSTGMDK